MRWIQKRWEYVLPLAVAVLLRIFYVVVTPHGTRGHDVGGHIEYIHYLLEHWTLPPAHDGFQFYQPPLYYLVCALIMKGVQFFSSDPEVGHRLLQWFGMLLTFITLGIGAWITHMLFGKSKDWTQRFLFLSLFALIPGSVYFSARINNDVLYLVFAYLSIALMIRWWQKPSVVAWLLLCNALGVGLLVKTNMVLLIFPAAAILLLRPKLKWREKLMKGIAFVLIPFCIAAWFVVPPFLGEEDTRAAVVGNVAQMTGPIPVEAKYMLTFNPYQILTNPFNVVSGDEARRLYLWEFFFRSSFFGEFSYPNSFIPIAIVILFSALMLIPFAAYEGIRDIVRWRSSSTMPLWLISGAIMAGAFSLRVAMPFSCSQDFRYSMGLLVPFLYYAFCRQYLKGRFWAGLREAAGFALLIGCIAFTIALIVHDWHP